MANEQDKMSLGNFGIQDTMQMGMGNPSLLDGFLDAGAATAAPDSLEKIVKTVEETPTTLAPPKGKEIPLVDKGETPSAESLLAGFLGSGEEEEEEEEVVENQQKGGNTVKQATAAALNDEGGEGEDVDSTKFEALSQDLFKLGVFTPDSEDDEGNIPEIKTPEDFLERFQAEKKKGAIEIVNNFIGQFGEDYQDAFDAIFVKGVNPKDYFETYNNIVDFSTLDLSVEANQEYVVRQALKDQGFDPEDIDTEVERYKNYGDLETVATKHHKVLLKKDSLRLQDLEAKAEKELQNKAAVRTQYINNVQAVLQEKLETKEFDGIPLNPKLAGELQDFLLVDKYKTASGETLTDFDKTILELKLPENHQTKVKIALILKLLEKDPTLSTIQKTGVTKKANHLFESVARQTTKDGNKSATAAPTPSKWFS